MDDNVNKSVSIADDGNIPVCCINFDTSTGYRFNFCRIHRKIHSKVGRKIKGPSDVVPDQSYTIRELFERAVLNSSPVGLNRPFYAEDTDNIDVLFARSGIDINTLDLTEIEEYRDMLNERIKLMNNAAKSHQQKTSKETNQNEEAT